MKHPRPLAFVLAFALLAVACGDDGTSATTGPTTTDGAAATTTTIAGSELEGFARFGSGDYPFSMQYPEDWTVDPDNPGVVVMFLSPLTDGDQFSENVNVVVEDLGGADLTLDEYIGLAMAQLAPAIENFSLNDEFGDVMGGVDSWILTYSGTQNGLDITWVQEIAVFEGHAYIVTYTGTDEYLDHRPDAIAMFQSFEFHD
jgi:hypothetical protein